MALTSAANVRAMSAGQGIPAAEDTFLGVLIGRAGPLIAKYCGYPPASVGASRTMESATYTRYTGDSGVWVDPSDRRMLHLEPWPVTAITTVHDDRDEEYGAATLVSADDYARTGEHGQYLRLKTTNTHGRWSLTDRAIKVVFVAGYSSVPGDLEHAAIETVLWMWGLKPRRGMVSVGSTEGLNTVFRPEDLPDHVRAMLESFRLPSVYL